MPISSLFSKWSSSRSGSYDFDDDPTTSHPPIRSVSRSSAASFDRSPPPTRERGVSTSKPVDKEQVSEVFSDVDRSRHLPVATDTKKHGHAKESWLSSEFLFDPQILIDLRSCTALIPLLKTPLPSHLELRPLRIADYDKGYMQLLAQLTTIGDVTRAQFYKRFMTMRSCDSSYYIVVIAERESKQCVGTCSLVVEWKFIHSAGFRGRLEDIVVDGGSRGMKLGNILCEVGTALGRFLGCYKLSLECKDALIPFYGKTGFRKDDGNNFMVQRFDTPLEVDGDRVTNDTPTTPPTTNVLVANTPPSSDEIERQTAGKCCELLASTPRSNQPMSAKFPPHARSQPISVEQARSQPMSSKRVHFRHNVSIIETEEAFADFDYLDELETSVSEEGDK